MVNFYDVCVCFLNILCVEVGVVVTLFENHGQREREKSAELRREGEVPHCYPALRLGSMCKHEVLFTLRIKL